MRRAIYEWGSEVVGRYKCFDARVVAAINGALGETDSPFVLNEPKNRQGTDCKVSCVVDGDFFRLQGHAPFDIVFGYGCAGVEEDPAGSISPTARETLANAVGMLGWDLLRLQENRYQPVVHALSGLPLDYGIQVTKPPSVEPAIDVDVHFRGPFSAVEEGDYRCLFTDEIARGVGVYFWTINVGGKEWPWYVGQTTRGFGVRMGEHIAEFLCGGYSIYDAAALSRGECRLADGAIAGQWPRILPSFLRNHERLMPKIIGLIRLIEIHVAPLAPDERLLNRVEGAIGRYYKTHSDPNLRDFFFPGLRVPAAIPFDKPIRLVLSSEVPVAGLPQYLLA